MCRRFRFAWFPPDFRQALAVLLVALPTHGAEGFEVQFHAWYGDNAVLATDQWPTRPSGRRVSLTGQVTEPSRLRWSTSFNPGEWARASTARGPWIPADGRAWALGRSHFGRDAFRGLRSGVPFDLILAERGRDRDIHPVVQATNVVVGTVWLLVVNPGPDSHELPSLTPMARERIRVLPLDSGFIPLGRQRWLAPVEAEHARLFCGLPRAFANSLAKEPVAETGGLATMGLVLCKASDAPSITKAARSISRWAHDQGEGILSGFGAVARAINCANDDVEQGARARFERAKAAWEQRSAESRFEGKVYPNPVAAVERWTLVAIGDDPALPFRMTGIVR
jgi:hypothetical protein